jgi:hypothetical protein
MLVVNLQTLLCCKLYNRSIKLIKLQKMLLHLLESYLQLHWLNLSFEEKEEADDRINQK